MLYETQHEYIANIEFDIAFHEALLYQNKQNLQCQHEKLDVSYYHKLRL